MILWQGVHGEGRGGGENVTKMSNNNNEPPDCGRHTEPLRRAAQESRGGAAHSVTPAALTFNLTFEPLTFFTYLVTYQHGSPTVAAKAISGSSGNTVISVVLSTQVGQRLRPNWDLWHTKVCLFREFFIYLFIFLVRPSLVVVGLITTITLSL